LGYWVRFAELKIEASPFEAVGGAAFQVVGKLGAKQARREKEAGRLRALSYESVYHGIALWSRLSESLR
jgi:hypothetical protein